MKKIITSLVIGVAVVAMLAMLVSPVLAGSASWREGTTGIGWKAYAVAEGTWGADIYSFTSTSQSYEIAGIVTPLDLWYHTGEPTISYAELEGHTDSLWVTHIHAEAWVSPPGFEYRYGGTWYTW